MTQQTKAEVAALYKTSLAGFDSFESDAANPAVVQAAKARAEANMPGVAHVANRTMHVTLG